MYRTSFDPVRHGFRFQNGAIAWTRVPLPFNKVLCGGMIYAAMDYYLNGTPVPPDDEPPEIDSLLNDYIYNRQLDAHKNTVGRFLNGWTTWAGGMDPIWQDSVGWAGSGDNFGKLMASMACQRPAVLCLIGQSATRGHHVLAIGCEQPDSSNGQLAIRLYDPNVPMKTVELRSTMGIAGYRGPVGFKHTSGEVWRGYFVDVGYARKKPWRLTRDNWRFCTGCKGLFLNGESGRPCPAGGWHAGADAWNYVVRIGANTSGELGWRRCLACQQLYFGGDAGPGGRCPVGSRHTCKESENYSLRRQPINHRSTDKVVEEGGWRRCQKCAVLHYVGPGGLSSRCPTGGGHEAAGNSYWLDKISA